MIRSFGMLLSGFVLTGSLAFAQPMAHADPVAEPAKDLIAAPAKDSAAKPVKVPVAEPANEPAKTSVAEPAHALVTEFKAGTTLENLHVAYVGEMNANARYSAFAEKADKENYLQVGACSVPQQQNVFMPVII
ncbi:MAG: hypothetical protein WA705_18825 [Candidatus Ozemobacteraceae bacterium]